MKSFLTLAFMTLSLSAFGWGSPPPVPEVRLPKTEITDTGTIEIKLNVVGSPSQVARITRLKGVVSRIINSEKFKSRIIGSWYQGKAQFVMTDLSNEGVYQSIRRGSELGSGADYTWDLDIGIASNKCSVLGWTNPSITRFYFNSCGFEERTDAGLAGTMCHEYSHKLGFDHDFYRTARREYSVPYAIGNICSELYSQFI